LFVPRLRREQTTELFRLPPTSPIATPDVEQGMMNLKRKFKELFAQLIDLSKV
jgi:hypothetical protein